MMVCPSCGSEYRDGFYTCVDCGSALTMAPPEDHLNRWALEPDRGDRGDPAADLVPVLETGNPSLVPIAKSILESAGIEFFTRGEAAMDVVAWGPFPSAINTPTAPVVFYVRPGDVAEATSLLRDLASAGTAPAVPPADASSEDLE